LPVISPSVVFYKYLMRPFQKRRVNKMDVKKGCTKKIYDGWHYHLCKRKPNVQIDDKWYCPSHNPEAIKKREEKTKSLREAKQCKVCHWHLERWWSYCPNCGGKRDGG